MGNLTATLDDRYLFDQGQVYLTGTQALVRLLLIQRRRDVEAGLNTAGFISGYRGSPMTAMDQELWQAKAHLDPHQVRFWPAVNEHMAATALWGTQQVHYRGDARYDGVFGAWYGKGPGLDQSLDAIRQANYHGTSKHGGVLVLAGDDPAMRSTVDAYHSELLFEDLLMPVLYPADIQEVFDLGLYGFALSRFCGAWVGYKLLPETIEGAASICADHGQIEIVHPEFDFPPDGVNSRYGDMWFNQESRLRRFKLPAALAFARANQLNRVTHRAFRPRFGIAAMGRQWRDVLQALSELGLGAAQLAELGISVLKVTMPFPADLETYRAFAQGLQEVLVVEDKREQIENGLRTACYPLAEAERPRIVGRRDQVGQPLVDDLGDLSADKIARAIAKRIAYFHRSEAIAKRLDFLDQQARQAAQRPALQLTRMPYFCSGCPHNRSTKVPEGSRAYGGVGCHFMAYWMEREVDYPSQMGGEGIPWVGQAPFVETPHVFQQMGDGTYFHSGLIAIRAALAAGVNITYKILFNDAVAMTGGQPVDGQLSVPQITRQVHDEGVRRIALVSDEPHKYAGKIGLAPGTTVHDRNQLNAVQRELREVPGVSVLIYDQTCAAEKRRRRKRGAYPDPAKRLFIHDRVCEGCGDCGQQSNCVSILPLDTVWGRKRGIDQSSCNKDYSCNDGFCPSFVTVLGGTLRKGRGMQAVPAGLALLPEPELPSLAEERSYGILIGGVGGTGVVTVGALLGMAAHLDGKGVSIVDQLGFAQKGGPVSTQVRIAAQPNGINSPRLNAGNADLLLGCDQLVISGDEALTAVQRGRTRAVVNSHQIPTGDFVRDPDMRYPADALRKRLLEALGERSIDFVDATAIATALLGDSIASNLFLVGFAWQKGLIPLSRDALYRAIELNAVRVEWNQEAFEWGRRAARNPSAVQELANGSGPQERAAPASTQEWIDHFAEELERYQNRAYAQRYRGIIDQLREAAQAVASDANGLELAAARNLYKLMAYKDEYEVARLFASPEFEAKLQTQFEGPYRLQFNLSPPIFAPKDGATGLPRKIALGGWMLPVFKLLARFRFLRGTPMDPFGRTGDRRLERQLVRDYETDLQEIAAGLNGDNQGLALDLLSLPDSVRGYGHVKLRSVAAYQERRLALLEAWRNPIRAIRAA